MDDLIYRSQAIEVVAELSDERVMRGPDEPYFVALAEVSDRIEALPGAERWIPVSERLPGEDELKDNGWFLGVVYGNAGNISYIGAVVTASFDPSAGWYMVDHPNADITVTHWMVLPEPPEEVRKKRYD